MFLSSTAMSASSSIFADVTGPGVSTISVIVFGWSVFSFNGTCFRFRMMSVASSTTPGIGEHSCHPPSIFTAGIAAPSIELNSARRKEFPTVVPHPRSKGCAENFPYLSVRVSGSAANRFGFWKPFHISTLLWPVCGGPTHFSTLNNFVLLRIQFDDQLLVHRRRLHVFAARKSNNLRFEISSVDVEPWSHTLGLCQVASFQDHRVLVHVVFQFDFIAHVHQIAGDVHFASLDPDVPVQHQLPGLRTRSPDSHPVDHIVQATFQHHHQVRACGALLALRLLEIVAELALQQAVGALHLLLFAQLHAITHHLRLTGLPVLPRNEVALFNRAFFCKTPQAFQKEFLPFSSAQPADCFTMSCQGPTLLYRKILMRI